MPSYELRYERDEEAYGHPFPTSLVHAERPRLWRHQLVSNVRVCPFRYDPIEGVLLWFSKLQVRVDFVPDARLPQGYKAFRGSEGRWEAILGRTILNYHAGRNFRVAKIGASWARRGVAAGYEVKIRVEGSGVHRVDFETLEGVLGALEPIPWERVGLELRDFDHSDAAWGPKSWWVRYLPLDNDEDGSFGPGDGLVFYGCDAWECFDYSPGQKRFGRENVYWLLLDVAGAPSPEPDASWLNLPDPEPTQVLFDSLHFEENLWLVTAALSGDSSYASGPLGIVWDHYNWTYGRVREVDGVSRPIKVIRFELGEVVDSEDVSTGARIRIQGFSPSSSSFHHMRLWFSKSPSPEDTSWAFPQNPIVFRDASGGLGSRLVSLSADDMASAWQAGAIGSGVNYLKVYLAKAGDGIDNVAGEGASIDWLEIGVHLRPRLRAGRLQGWLEVGERGAQVDVVGLASRQVAVFDVTDPRGPVPLGVSDEQFEESEELVLRLQLAPSDPPVRRKLLVVQLDAAKRVEPEELSVPALPLPAYGGEEYVAIYPAAFAPTLERLLRHRENMGLGVYRAEVEAVYDAYSGGRRRAWAIKRLLMDIWRQPGSRLEHVLLVGDASNDIGGYCVGRQEEYGAADPETTWVPTVTIRSEAYVEGLRELASTDEWFVDNLGGSWWDFSGLPDAHVGRIPCSNTTELSTYIEKVLEFERPGDVHPWKRRIVLHSDDAFSTRGTVYQYRDSEDRFGSMTLEAKAAVDSFPCRGAYVPDSLLMSAYFDSVPELGRCVKDPLTGRCLRDTAGQIEYVRYPIDPGPSQDFGKNVFRDTLFSHLDRGALMWAFQGHSNWVQLTHENIFYHTKLVREDVFRFSNIHRPFVFLGFGCHLAEFARHVDRRVPIGDGMPEAMLFCCPGEPKASVGIFASTTFEWIGHDIETHFFNAMFAPPPPGTDAPAWYLGEICTAAKVLDAGHSYASSGVTYTLLGDPGLRLELNPPQVELTVNGTACGPWSGPLTWYSEDGDTLLAIFEFCETTPMDTLRYSIDHGGVAKTLELRADSLFAEGHRGWIEYWMVVEPCEYDFVFSVADVWGYETTVTFHFPFDVSWWRYVPDEEPEWITEGDVVPKEGSLGVRISTGVRLDVDDLMLVTETDTLRALSFGVDSVQAPPGTFGSGWIRRYQVEFEPPSWGELDRRVFRLLTRRSDGVYREAASAEFVRAGKQRIRDCYAIPNPFEDETYFYYVLGNDVPLVQLRIFTATGKKVLVACSSGEEAMTRHLGRNWFLWDGTDEEGDEVANGVYFYELVIADSQGKVLDRRLGKVVRVR